MSSNKRKVLVYRRVNWLGNKTYNLQKLLINCHAKLPSTGDRTFKYKDAEIQCLAEEVRSGVGFFLHVATYFPDQATSLVPKASRKASDKPVEKDPPPDCDYMAGDVMGFVVDNHVFICSNDARESVLSFYFKEIFSKVGLDPLEFLFGLEKTANMDKLKLLADEGLSRICLNASLYDASYSYLKRSGEVNIPQKLIGGLINELWAMVQRSDMADLKKEIENNNVQIKAEILINNRKKGGDIVKSELRNLAKDIIDEDQEGFAIITGKGRKIFHDEIVISSPVDLPPHGKSVQRDETWNALEQFYRSLKEQGVLEE